MRPVDGTEWTAARRLTRPGLTPRAAIQQAHVTIATELAQREAERIVREAVERDGHVLTVLRETLAHHVRFSEDDYSAIVALWIVATHWYGLGAVETFPQLHILSPQYGSGKSTTLDWIEELAFNPLRQAGAPTVAWLGSALDKGPAVLLFDEAGRNLTKDELQAALNATYRRKGATRQTNRQSEDSPGKWHSTEQSLFAPVALAGLGVGLPEDMRSRAIAITQQRDSRAPHSSWGRTWERTEANGETTPRPTAQMMASALLAAIVTFAHTHATAWNAVLPETVQGRDMELWEPLARVAEASGDPSWTGMAHRLAVADAATKARAREAEGDGVAITLLRHVREAWRTETATNADGLEGIRRRPRMFTQDLIDAILREHPDTWGDSSDARYGRLTPERIAATLHKHGIESPQATNHVSGTRRAKAHHLSEWEPLWRQWLPEQQEERHDIDGLTDALGITSDEALRLIAS